MLLAITQEITSITAPTGGDTSQTYNNLIDYTFDTSAASGSSVTSFILQLNVSGVTYVGIAGHNIGTLGATITVNNHGTNDVLNYAPIDDRPLMFALTARTGGTFRITITKPMATDVVRISHIAAGQTTDLTGTTTGGQVVERDYQSNYPRAPMNLNRRVRSVINESGAPTSTLVKTISTKMSLNISNMPTPFAEVQLLQYQRFWVENGFFIQNDDKASQTYLAFQFIPSAPKSHNATREVVNLSYSFLSYNGQ